MQGVSGWKSPLLAVLLLVLLSCDVGCQLMGVLNQDEHNLIYQVEVPAKESRVAETEQELYFTHKETFKNCSISFDFFSLLTTGIVDREKSQTTRLVVTDNTGKVLLDKHSASEREDDDTDASWRVVANNGGDYTISIENLDSKDAVGVVMANFHTCKKFEQVVQKDEVATVTERTEKAIGTLFHNIVELEQSESRLIKRKESSLC